VVRQLCDVKRTVWRFEGISVISAQPDLDTVLEEDWK
jgi:hypothetical protein